MMSLDLSVQGDAQPVLVAAAFFVETLFKFFACFPVGLFVFFALGVSGDCYVS